MWEAVSGARHRPNAPIAAVCDGIRFCLAKILPHHILEEAQQEALNCDLMIVAGRSSEVMPSFALSGPAAACILIMTDLSPT